MKKEKIFINILLSFLALHLIYSNSDLLIASQEMINDTNLSITEIITKIVFAVSYSILTVTLLYLYPKMWLIVIVAILDGYGIYLKYNVNQANFIFFVSLYFGLYTCIIVISAGLIQKCKKADKSELKSDVSENKSEQSENKAALKIELKSLTNRINATKNEEKRSLLIAQKEDIIKILGK